MARRIWTIVLVVGVVAVAVVGTLVVRRLVVPGRAVAEAPVVAESQVPAPTASTSPSSAPAVGAAVTARVELKPVDSTGKVVAGWAVEDHRETTVDCAEPSPAATAAGIHSCAPGSAAADACYAEPGGATVLCLVDPFRKTLWRYRAVHATYEVEAPADPSPLGLELADGQKCILRNGGAWPGRADDENAYGTYSCQDTPFVALWGTKGRPDIDTSSALWTVPEGGSTGPLRTVGIRTAYFVSYVY
jgi:hypothetical protein